MRKSLIITAVLFFVTNVNGAEVLAPFGFEWGMDKKIVESKGVALEKCDTELALTICQTKKPIKSVSFGEVYYLLFDSKIGLQKVSMSSQDVTNDITGSSGKKLYFKAKDSLTKKYGEPKAYEQIGTKLYKKYDEFYQCLRYAGCGMWTSLWQRPEGGMVLVELKGKVRGTGYLSMSYESKKWSDVLKAREANETAIDADAL